MFWCTTTDEAGWCGRLAKVAGSGPNLWKWPNLVADGGDTAPPSTDLDPPFSTHARRVTPHPPSAWCQGPPPA
eukprot:CAMPEP_0174368338 /NCGR_PEP_ID=MMETSP0811_2-20130205/88685_1 /TAXON_ID=73025 ORGANISM="Eutreptiella gymnastica-like, Strain CCMP1594" /NCGR_SAMPLE_ID=MMETSP0811_2 /ASSEMBLY_ACC=CAM_ASM_000667 /LENGTH=72 /DNA_ID=CAMNT_0015511755 /DNA_START=101 /DNA_END=315 /DNA_ORIENTATION=+